MEKNYIYIRLMLVCLFVFISFGVYGIINVIQKQEKTISTNALPVTNKVIIIDAGHGKPDERCCTDLMVQQKKRLI